MKILVKYEGSNVVVLKEDDDGNVDSLITLSEGETAEVNIYVASSAYAFKKE